ncbi:MAG: exonuclease domain-containing protein [Chitinispirillia bacterium]|nr:exonuclease domain-containing protein [Chitinispirillia bacterium]
MPRLFDLLPDSSKKELLNEAKKSKAVPKNAKVKAVNNNLQKNNYTAAVPLAVPDFVAIDVETTGLEFKKDRVIEIGAARFINGKLEKEFSTFINPGVSIPEHITQLTSINNDDVKDAPKFSDIALSLVEFIGTLPICGHQIEFDHSFINEELKRAAFQTITPPLLDTALLSRVLLQPIGRFSLKFVCESLGVSLSNAHRALHDAKASGEVACRLVPKLADFPLEIRQALAACAPGGLFKTLMTKTLGAVRYGIYLKDELPFADKPLKLDIPESFLEIDPSEIEELFSDSDKINKLVSEYKSNRQQNKKPSGTNKTDDPVNNFVPRESQSKMAAGVMEALNKSEFFVVEAGTGTGKSLAYLVPAAKHALKNNCRVIISTHTRNLQDQLISKDIPAAAALSGGDLRFTTLKGRNNYLCRHRFYKLLRGEAGNISPRERSSVLPLVVWSQTTETGDIEEQTFFNPKWFFKVWNLISSDGQDCLGRRCPHFSNCFLHRARSLAQGSHIVVINHALFYSDVCSNTSFLGPVSSIIFDEAHHLESSGHQHLRTELDTNRMNAFIDQIQNLLHDISSCKELEDIASFEKEIKAHLKHLRKRSGDFLAELSSWALNTVPESKADYQIGINENSLKELHETAVFDLTLSDMKDTFSRFKQALSAMPEGKNAEELRGAAQFCSEYTSQLRADLQYLTNAKTEDHVFWLEGNHEKKWTKLCGVQLDISVLLSQIWERCGGAVIFTSATLAAQGSTEYFNRGAGLNIFGDRTSSMVLPSPYSANQMLFGAIRECPEPDNPAFAPFVAEAVANVHSKLNKNILVLFTSNSMLNNVYNNLKSRTDIDKAKLLAQGLSGNRTAMLDQFKAQKGMMLLGTDSFWEGIDVPGEACEVVIIPRLPFPVPTHPLTVALGQRMETLYGSSFFAYSVPEAIIKFRQGAGRLIRSASDRGALIVLDNRIVTKGYGKQFVRAISSSINEFADIDIMTEKMRDFFESDPDSQINNDNITYEPFEDLP